MNNEDSQSTETLDLGARKFTQSGYWFLGLNLAYLAIAMFFIPPFNLGLSAVLSLVAFLLLLGVLTYYLLKGKKRLAQILAIIYGARSIFSAYSLTDVSTFQAVPYLLPCLLITFYLLGRAGWDWR
jgi:FtsH-binding integral membrane protein